MNQKILLLLLFSLIHCSSSQKSSTQFRLRPFKEHALSNGLKVIVIHDKSLPSFSLVMYLKLGNTTDPKGKQGLSYLTSEMLAKGTTQRNAGTIADELAFMGSSFGASVDPDYSSFSIDGLSTHKVEILKNFSEIILHPSFDKKELRKLKSRTSAHIKQGADEPSQFAHLAFDDFLFENHPYGNPVSGNLNSIRKIRRKDIIRHYIKYYRPNNAILAVVGQAGPTIVQDLEAHFGKWKSRKLGDQQENSFPGIKGLKIKLVHKSDLQQTQIRFGHKGIKRTNPDFLSVRLANMILGRGFASRLVDKIRDDLGLTYSIGSNMDARRQDGPFLISTFTRNEKVGETIQETLKVYQDFYSTGVSEEEVKAAKGYLFGLFPKAVETPEKLAHNLLLLRIFGIPDSYLTEFETNVSAIEAGDVNKAIKKYFFPKDLKILVYANKKKVLSQLEKIGHVKVQRFSDFL